MLGAGQVLTFLGATIFNITGGEPLLPLQTLWVSFTTLSIQSVGLGYSKPAAGLMECPPRPPSRPILTRGLIVWHALAGLLIAIGTLGVISWAEQAHGPAIARTTGMVTFALFTPFFSIECKDERESAFSLGTFSDKTFTITTSVSFVLLVLSTVMGIVQTVIRTVRLDRPAMADLHRRGPVDRRGRRDTQSRAAADRGDVIQPAGAPGRSCPLPNARRPPDMAGYAPVWQIRAMAVA
jgi:magnesium-transporting ATPase (P-type)